MNRKPNILAAFLALALALLLTACGAGGDRVERFAEANPGSGENIAIPGYEKLDFAAGKTAQTVNLKNPAENKGAGRGRVPRDAPLRLLYHRGQPTAQRSGDTTDTRSEVTNNKR